MKWLLVCVALFLLSIITFAVISQLDPELAQHIGQIASTIIGGLIVLGIIVVAIYMSLFYDPDKKRKPKVVAYILLAIAIGVVAVIALLIFGVVSFFKFITSGTFEGTATGIIIVAVIILVIVINDKIKKSIVAQAERAKREKEVEEAKKLREEIHQRELKRLEEKQAEQRRRSEAWIEQMKADGLSFDEMSRKMFGYDDDYDAMDPDEI